MASSTPTDLCALPAGVSPDGVYNFVNPPSLFPALLAVSIVLGVLSTMFVLGRLSVNRKKLRIADCMFPLLISIVLCAVEKELIEIL